VPSSWIALARFSVRFFFLFDFLCGCDARDFCVAVQNATCLSLEFLAQCVSHPVLPAQRASVFSFEAPGTPCSSCQFDFLVLCSIAAAGAQPGLVLEPPDQRLKFSGFSSYSCGRFSVTSTRCSMKCA
jgi:hypothetical protein